MEKRFVTLWTSLTIVVTLAGGYAFRNVTYGNREGSKSAPSVLNTKISKSSQLTEREERKGAIRQTKSNIEQAEGSERWLYWISALENASLDDFPQLARVAQGDESFLQLLAQRWFDADPWHFFRTLEEESNSFSGDQSESFPHDRLGSLIFAKWVQKDADGVIEALSSSAKLLRLADYRITAFSEIMRSDPRRGLLLMNRWEIRNFGPNTQGVVKWAKENPREVAAAILENAAGTGTEHCMEAVASVWAKSDPEGALAFARDAKGTEGAVLRETVFREWSARDIGAASEWLTEQNDPALDDYYRPMVIEAWAKEDPQQALAWCEEHLTGPALTESMTTLMRGVAAVNIELAADLVRDLEPGRPKEQAARMLASQWFPERWSTDSKIPQQAVEWLRSIEENDLKEAILEEVDGAWAEHDAEGYWDFVLEEGNQSLSVSSFHNLVNASMRSDPKGTLEWASGLEGERSLDALDTAFGNWQLIQPTQATAWFRELPNDDARRPAIMETLVTGAAYLPREVAAETFRELSSSDRVQARTILENSRVSEERKVRIRELLGE